MKRRIGVTIAMAVISLLFSLLLAQAQQQRSQEKVDPCKEPAIPAIPPIPAVPPLAAGPQQATAPHQQVVPPVPVIPPIPVIPAVDPLGDVMFPPDLIMRHARELELTGEQKSFMQAEIQQTTARFNELQWQLQEEMEALHGVMKANSVNNEQAMAQLDKVLNVEREVKRLRIGMGIRLKNQLTPAQQAKLREIKRTRG